MDEIIFSERENAIMQEAFMTGRVYNQMGEKETPIEIQEKLKFNCARAVRQAAKNEIAFNKVEHPKSVESRP